MADFHNLDLKQIFDAINGGGGGSSATSANQTLQITQETNINTKLQNIIDEQSALGVATGLNGTGTIIIPNANKFFTNLFIQAPDNLSGSTFKIEVSATSGTANFREVGTIDVNNEFFEYSGYFGQIRLTRLTGSATTLNWYTTNRPKGDAKDSSLLQIQQQLAELTDIKANLNNDYVGSKISAYFSEISLSNLNDAIQLYISVGNKKLIGFSMVHHVGGNYEAIVITQTI
jgi:hypothetical protein